MPDKVTTSKGGVLLQELIKDFPLEKLTQYSRYPWGPEDLTGLRKSLAHGQNKPLVVVREVRPTGVRKNEPSSSMVIADGVRRYAAMEEMGLSTANVLVVDDFSEVVSLLPNWNAEDEDCQVPWRKRQLHLMALYASVISPLGLTRQNKMRSVANTGRAGRPNNTVALGNFRGEFTQHMGLTWTTSNDYAFVMHLLSLYPRPSYISDALAKTEAGEANYQLISERARRHGIRSRATRIEQVEEETVSRVTRSLEVTIATIKMIARGDLENVDPQIFGDFLERLAEMRTVATRTVTTLKKGL